jgi:esterase/lipase superfamily enzyme
MKRAYHQWFSPALQRNMELLVFGHAGRAVLFFPTRMARFYDYENWGIVGSVLDKLENGELQLFCVDSIDAESFYNKSIHPADRIARYIQYESYLLHEVMPLMSTINGGNQFEAAGCSMGAYHAVNIGLKHPELFVKVTGMSGRYDLTVQLPDYNDLFDGYRNEDIYFNMPSQYMANLTDEGLINAIKKLDITLAVGQADPFLPGNQSFSDVLWSKGIAHQFYIWDKDAHRPKYWRQMVKYYL